MRHRQVDSDAALHPEDSLVDQLLPHTFPPRQGFFLDCGASSFLFTNKKTREILFVVSYLSFHLIVFYY